MPHFDKLETRTPEARQADQLAALLAQLARVDAQQGNCLIGAARVPPLAELAKLNVLRQSDCSAWKTAHWLSEFLVPGRPFLPYAMMRPRPTRLPSG